MRRDAATQVGVTIYHNPNCNSSSNAVAIADELGVDVEIVNYRSSPPDADELRAIIAKLEDPPTDLVRRDALFEKLGLTDADVATVDQIVDVIVAQQDDHAAPAAGHRRQGDHRPPEGARPRVPVEL